MALEHSETERMNDLILVQFQTISLPWLNCVHSYIAAEKYAEPDTSLILRFLQFRYPDIKIAAPRIEADGFGMTHHLIEDFEEMELNKYGIEEPAAGEEIAPKDIDLILVPLLAFDEQGYRAGFGKGYYDRFLSECREDAIKIGISFFAPAKRIDDVDEHDVKLDYCCTPEKVYQW